MFWFEAADRESHQARKIEKFSWTRSQRWKVEGKARRVVTTPTWRNKSYHRRDLDRTIFQVKEDVLEGSTKHPTFRTIPKVEGNGRASHYVHGRGCWKGSPPTWQRNHHHFACCWLYDQKGVSGKWEFGRHLILSWFLANEAWMRSTSSSKFTLGRIWRDESATRGYHYVTCGGRSISTTDNQRSKLSCHGLFVIIKHYHRKTNFK